MTRRKDTLRNKTERIRIIQQKGNSRIEKQLQKKKKDQEEKLQEKQLLNTIFDLPNELIRLIYGFMSGNAKMIFFPKYESLRNTFCSYDFTIEIENLFKKMSKMEILLFLMELIGILFKKILIYKLQAKEILEL
jgi:hypothetical protein